MIRSVLKEVPPSAAALGRDDGAEDRPQRQPEIVPPALGVVEPRHAAVDIERVGGRERVPEQPARKVWKFTAASEIAMTTVPSARTPTPLRMLSDSDPGMNRGCSAPSVTSNGPDCVARVQSGRASAKARVSITRAWPPAQAEDPIGQEPEVSRPGRGDERRDLAPVPRR